MSVEKVREYFKQFGIEKNILTFDVSSATVDLASEAVGVPSERICKTLSFYDKNGGAILIQMAGDARVDNRKYKDKFHQKAKFLSPEDVFAYTGHPIGGVCAFAVERKDVQIYCDISLQRFKTVFPACGTANSAIELSNEELFQYSNAIEWIDVSKF